ncbi:MAG: ferrochelatase [Hyphomonadaceae bacterium]|nr:ferrochelatase [Hyphomonadaceae bacterium]
MTQRKIAVVLFNLGGPDGPAAVRPFLFNLFRDPRIITAPAPVRLGVAALIALTRTKSAKANYAVMGGGSPILKETQAQADALAARLEGSESSVFKVFVAMRYWKPFAADAAAAVRAWGADDVVLLPLYPQFSTTTTASAEDAWAAAYDGPTHSVCCYPANTQLVTAHAETIERAWKAAGSPADPRVLFSAHGLPQRVVDAGDSYQWQVERTVAAVSALLPPAWEKTVCYQSRVGPLKWLGPSTEEALAQAATDGRGVIVSPIAFVSEHIETLVELDVEYAEKAHALGLPFYIRAPALGTSPVFIDGLAALVRKALLRGCGAHSESGGRLCPDRFGACPMKAVASERSAA